jgi:hypothetical protein
MAFLSIQAGPPRPDGKKTRDLVRKNSRAAKSPAESEDIEFSAAEIAHAIHPIGKMRFQPGAKNIFCRIGPIKEPCSRRTGRPACATAEGRMARMDAR